MCANREGMERIKSFGLVVVALFIVAASVSTTMVVGVREREHTKRTHIEKCMELAPYAYMDELSACINGAADGTF